MGRKLKNTIIGIGALTAVAHSINQIIFKYAVRKEILDFNNGKYFKTNNGKMFYREYGNEGSPILLIHDINIYSSGYEWINIVDRLSKNHKVYVVDLIGCGRSSKLNISYTSYLYVQILNDFINNVIDEKVNIVASGKSVSVAIKMYELNNKMINRIFAISPEYINDVEFCKNDTFSLIKDKIIISPIWGTLIYNFAASKNLIEEKFEEEFYFDKKKIKSRIVNAFYESAHLSGSNSKFMYYSLYKNYMFCDTLNSLNNIDYYSFKVIFGDKDETADKIRKQFMKYNENLNYDYVANSKKMPHLENGNEVVSLINDFFD